VPALGELAGAPEGLPFALGAEPGVPAPPVAAMALPGRQASRTTTAAMPILPTHTGRTNPLLFNR
jgi:hypothetical protein